ncbi:hypothetical protein OA57_10520 [Chelonobacter oris]|uniref:Ubiquinone biosynthesis accessory factor UbiJ n=1 Tax=Chelonobacter oris TaxID=505317 RepID=A0A0A3AK72_9PAST|nr:SCP2 sterol-binding domain-containing protein [Chelonobacter oris]KGQ69686.1 hypothetical protein OA57_10520 [Chelonobacter oris]
MLSANLNKLKTQLLLPQLLNAAIETALSYLLQRSENSQPHLRKLNGKVLALQLQQLEITVYFVFSLQQIDVLQYYEGEADCRVQTSAKIGLKIPKKAELTQLINNKSLVLHGDLQVLQDFLALLEQLETDPAELLAPYLGDVPAYNAVRFVKQVFAFFSGTQQNARQHWRERLSEEWQLTAPRLAVTDFHRQVVALDEESNALEQRFQQLINKLGTQQS